MRKRRSHFLCYSLPAVVVPTSGRVLMESPISSEMNEEDSDKDQDFIDDYDSEEERRQKKKKRVWLPFPACIVKIELIILNFFLYIILEYQDPYNNCSSEICQRARKTLCLQ